MEWKRLRYHRLPQGYTAAGNAYTRHYGLAALLKERVSLTHTILVICCFFVL